jgi:predicted PurR-regulated permease PerM
MLERKSKYAINSSLLFSVLLLVLILAFTSSCTNQSSQNGTQTQTQAESDQKAASDMDARITALGDPNNLTMDKSTAVSEARTAYNSLTSAQKNLVTKLDVLAAAEKKISDLQAAVAKEAADKKAA